MTYDVFVDHGGEVSSDLDTVLLLGYGVTCQLQLREGGRGKGGGRGRREGEGRREAIHNGKEYHKE